MSSESESRAAFETWIKAPPYEERVERFASDSASWPGQYRDLAVQVAWAAWQEAILVRSAAARAAQKDR